MDAARAQRVDRRAEAALVEQHLPLVHYAVNEVAARIPRHVSRADLVSAGMAGLAQAARSFDPSRGIAFNTYASSRIRGALLDDLRGRDWASRGVRSRARQIAAATDQLTAALGRTPSSTEVGEKVGLDAHAVEELASDVHRAVVLNYDALIDSGDGDSLLPSDEMSPEEAILDRERKAYLVDAVAALPERLRRVVVGYFFEELPMQTLADELGVSESRISQMRAEALELVKEGMNSQLEPDVVVDAIPGGRVSRRKAAYFDAVASGTDHAGRVAANPDSRGRLLALAGSRAVAS